MFEIFLKDDSSFLCNKDETIIEAAQRNNIFLEHSCLTGRCSSCAYKLLSGNTMSVSEETSLEEEQKESGYILTCIRKPVSNIKIEAEDLSQYGLVSPKTIPAKIQSIEEIATDIIQVELRTPPNQGVKFLEGQYLNVIWEGIKRSYSIASTSSEKTIRLFIKNYDGGKMSQYWFGQSKINDLVRIELPKGTFFLRNHHNKETLIFIATGTGIAPIKAILNSTKNQPQLKRYKRVLLLWGMKYTKDIFWMPESSFIEFFPVLSRESIPKKHVQEKLSELDIDFSKAVIYACGGEQMINTTKFLAIANGLSDRDFYSDAFVASN